MWCGLCGHDNMTHYEKLVIERLGEIVSVLDDLKGAVSALNTSVSAELAAIAARLGNSGSVSDADVEAAVSSIQGVVAQLDAETAVLTGISFPLTIAAPAVSATVGAPYVSAFVVTGGKPPFSFTIVSGGLPDTFVLDAVNGAVTGTPAAAGSFNFTGQVTDSNSPVGTATVAGSITVV